MLVVAFNGGLGASEVKKGGEGKLDKNNNISLIFQPDKFVTPDFSVYQKIRGLNIISLF